MPRTHYTPERFRDPLLARPAGFRLRYALALIAVVAAYGWAGHGDYIELRASECREASPPRGYDAAADRCTARLSDPTPAADLAARQLLQGAR